MACSMSTSNEVEVGSSRHFLAVLILYRQCIVIVHTIHQEIHPTHGTVSAAGTMGALTIRITQERAAPVSMSVVLLLFGTRETDARSPA